MKPTISVVIAYYDERRSAQNIATWTQRQTLAADDFEVIVVAASGTKVEPALSTTLREQDRLLRIDKPNPYALYCAGANAARGDILLFSEDHVIAEPNCLQSVQSFFHERNVEAATLSWGCISKTVFAKAEERYNDLDRAQIESGSESWNRVRIRGFAIKKALYENIGGFNESYWFFCGIRHERTP